MTTPALGAQTFLTMQPDIEPAVATYVDQVSFGRDGTDSVYDARRAAEHTLGTTKLTANYAAAITLREVYRTLQNTIVTATDASGINYADTRIRRCRPVAFAQADGTGLVVCEWDILVASGPAP